MNAHDHGGDFGRYVGYDRDCGLFPGYTGICSLQDHKEIGSMTMAHITREELLEKLFHEDYEHLKGI